MVLSKAARILLRIFSTYVHKRMHDTQALYREVRGSDREREREREAEAETETETETKTDRKRLAHSCQKAAAA